MRRNVDDDIPYLLLTPGPLTTSRSVREAMLRDYCTWDQDYNLLVSEIRLRLVQLSSGDVQQYTSVLMQGSGTFAVEATLGSVIPPTGKLLVLANGVYGHRMIEIAKRLNIPNGSTDNEIRQKYIYNLVRSLAHGICNGCLPQKEHHQQQHVKADDLIGQGFTKRQRISLPHQSERAW